MGLRYNRIQCLSHPCNFETKSISSVASLTRQLVMNQNINRASELMTWFLNSSLHTLCYCLGCQCDVSLFIECVENWCFIKNPSFLLNDQRFLMEWILICGLHWNVLFLMVPEELSPFIRTIMYTWLQVMLSSNGHCVRLIIFYFILYYGFI